MNWFGVDDIGYEKCEIIDMVVISVSIVWVYLEVYL